MPTSLSDPVWQGISVIVAVVLGLVPLITHWLRRDAKHISYGIKVLQLQGSRDLASAILGGRHSSDIEVVLIQIKNTGNRLIVAQDFLQPIKVTLHLGDILAAGVTNTIPKNLQAQVVVEEDNRQVILTPLSLNPRESLTIWVLVSGVVMTSVDGRIAESGGLRSVRLIDRLNSWIRPIVYAVLVWFVVLILVIVGRFYNIVPGTILFALLIITLSVSVICSLLVLFLTTGMLRKSDEDV